MRRHPLLQSKAFLSLLLLTAVLLSVRLFYLLRQRAVIPCARAELARPMLIEQRLRVAGSVAARGYAQVAPASPGLVDRVYVRRGDRVHTGQLLVRLASEDLDLELRRRELAVLRAERDYETLASTASALDRRIREAELRLSRAERDALKRKLALRDLRAPFTGRILQIPVSEGQLMTPGGGGIYVLDPDSLFVEIEGDEFEVAKLNTEMTGVATIEGVGKATLQIRVRTPPALKRLRMGNGSPSLFSVEADIISGITPDLQPGLSARVDLLVAKTQVPVAVPLAYVDFRDRRPYLTVCSDGSAPKERPVTLGVRNSQFVEIRSNLRAGERLLAKSGVL